VTCIVGLVHQGTVYMGGDSCGSDRHTYTDAQGHKVFASGEHLIGCTGTFRLIDLLRRRLSVDPPREGVDPEDYIRGDFLDAAVKVFDDHGYLESKSGVKSFCGAFLIGWRGSLWEVQDDLSVIAIPPWGHAVGSGNEAARGALWSCRGAEPASRVHRALRAAEAIVTTVRGPHRVWKIQAGKVTEVAFASREDG
jgi:hypothetical protein